MSNPIKDFFRKKKLDAQFKMAGSGHRLTDNNPRAATSSQSKQINPNRNDSSKQRAAEAAIDRIGRQQSSHNKTNTLDNILQEERKKISEEYKLKEKERVETMDKEEVVKDKRYDEFESKQLYSCPTIGLNESQPIAKLMEQINDYIENNFTEDFTLLSVMTIINCNFSISDDCQQRIDECISTLDKIVTNLSTSTPENREKFSKIRKIKIEKKILELKGGLEFLISIGFELDSNEEWLVFKGDEEQITDQMNYYKDVLNNAQQFPIILDRQPIIVEKDSAQAQQNLSEDVFQLTAEEVSREMKLLTEKRELEETLRTKAMREQKPKKPNSKYSRLRFKFPDGIQMEATFGSLEALSDVKNWLSQYSDSINEFNLKCGPQVFSDEHLSKSIKELNLVPSGTLLIISK